MAPAGQYRERVAFEYRALVSDGFGNQQSATWTEAFICSARVRPLRGGESVQAARLSGRQPTLITVRVNDNTKMITTDWRARDVRSGVTYNIRSKVNPDERRVDFDMECETGVVV